MTDKKNTVRDSIKISKEILSDIRSKIPQLVADGHRSRADLGRTLSTFYPQFARKTLEDYCGAVDPTHTSDYLFSLVLDNQMSIHLFMEIALSVFDKVSKDTIAREAVTHPRLEAKGISYIKRVIRESRGKVAIGTAIMMAKRKLPIHAKAEDVKKTVKFFGGIVKDLNDAALFFQTTISEAIKVIPGSAIEDVNTHMEMWHKLNAFEATLENALNFVRGALPRYLEIVKTHAMTEAEMAMKRTEGGM